MKRKLFLLLCALLTMIGVQAQSWTGNAPVANGTFFLYNVEAQKFLNNGDPNESWGTNAYLQAGFGMDIKLEANGGAFNLNTNVSNGGDSHYLATSTWCDGGATPWTFTAVAGQTNTYTISNGGSYLVANDALNDVEYKASTGDAKSWWKLVSLDDFKAAMAAKVYSTTDPMDVSVFISGRSFARNDGRNNTWVTSHSGGNWDFIGGAENKYYGNEAWNNTFDVHQEITGLPAGTYKLSCSGFGTNGTTYIYGTTGGVTTQNLISSDNTTSRGSSKANKWAAIQLDNAFAGQDTDPFVVANGKLTAGIKRETNTGGDWCIWDEFRLYYYGLDLSELVAAYESALSAAKTLSGTTKKMSDIALTSLNNTIDTYDEGKVDKTSQTALTTATNALSNAMDFANTSITSYNIIAAGVVPDNSLEGWTCENTNTFHINTWSTEGNSDGSNMKTPFIENWVGKGSYLGAGRVYYKLQGLNPGEVYYAQALVRSYNEASADAPNGPNFFINDKVVDMTEEGTTFTYNNMSGIYATLGGAATVGEDGTLTLGVEIANNRNYNWVAFKNVSIRAMADALKEARDAADAVNGKVMNANTQTALSAAISSYGTGTPEPTTEEGYNTAITALSIATANAESSVEVYVAANAAIEKAEGIIAETNVFVVSEKAAYQEAITTARSAYEDRSMENATASNLEVNLNGGSDYKHVGDPMRPFYSGAWSATNEVSIYTNNWSVEGNTDGSNFTTPFIEDWVADANSLANTTISASVTNLPTGTYNVTARVRMRLKNNGEAPVNGLSLQASSGEPVAVSGTPNYGSFYVAEVAATGYVTEEGGSLGINFIVNNTNASWLSIKAVNYERTGDLPVADAADYAALKDALDAVAGNVVGFEAGEYAPYNNKDAVAALNVAKAIDPTVTNVKFAVQAATAALTGATWTANAEEVNAFYKGDFAGYSEDTTTPLDYTPDGWTATANFRLMLTNTETYPGLNDASAKQAVMSWSGGITYGETAGYEIPLKANTTYLLKFKAAGWNNETRSGMNVSVLNGEDGLPATDMGTPDRDIKGNATNVAGMTSYEKLFETGAAGNYVFHIQSGNNFVVTDFEIVKAPTTYSANLKVNDGKLGTFIAPFDVTLPDNVKAYSATVVNNEVKLSKIDNDKLDAGTPVIVYGDGVSVDQTFYGVPTVEENQTVGNLVGILNESEKTVPVGAYVLQTQTGGQAFYKVASAAPGALNRCYVIAASPNARLVITFDGEDPTAINAIEAAEAEDGALKDGKYIIDNKVVIVKNGVKYSANGQILK